LITRHGDRYGDIRPLSVDTRELVGWNGERSMHDVLVAQDESRLARARDGHPQRKRRR
jgi:hypothetical protein